jgi:hypothetical protein
MKFRSKHVDRIRQCHSEEGSLQCSFFGSSVQRERMTMFWCGMPIGMGLD